MTDNHNSLIGEYLSVDEVKDIFREVFSMMDKEINALPDQLSAAIDMTPDLKRRVRAKVSKIQVSMYPKIGKRVVKLLSGGLTA